MCIAINTTPHKLRVFKQWCAGFLTTLSYASVLIVAGSLVGCDSTPNQVATLPNPSPIETDAYRSTFDTSIEVLRDAGFTINRQDFRFGKISSDPKGSPTAFEPWKPDNTYADQSLRSTLGNLRRTITVSLEPEPATTAAVGAGDDSPGVTGYGLWVEVLLERLQVPQRRMNGAASGDVFADLRQTPAELQDRGIDGQYWQPIGRDLHLEQRLLQSILSQASLDEAN